jgi:dihydrofolate synthase/folylpolyglutamate synthase
VARISATLKYLYGLEARGMKFGLENVRRLLNAVGDPHQQFAAVHIAGTNGKGSTAAMIASILAKAGYKTALYTSPHLVRFAERIRINGQEIPEDALTEYARRMRPAIEEFHATFFEATTAIAFRHFADIGVDIAVVETGLGGRLDATNVVDPLLTVITNIDIEHSGILGKTHARIAAEKGGIIKTGVPCVVGKLRSEALSVIGKIARLKNVPLLRIEDEVRTKLVSQSFEGLCLDIEFGRGSEYYRDVLCSLAGDFQTENVSIAIVAIRLLAQKGYARLGESAVREGLGNIQQLSGIRGRMEVLWNDPLVVVDVAHNPTAVRRFVDAFRHCYSGKAVMLFGVMKDKAVGDIVQELCRLSRLTVAVAPKTTRALEPGAIVAEFHRRSRKCLMGNDVFWGFREALRRVNPGEAVVVTGSHYIVGDLLKALNPC